MGWEADAGHGANMSGTRQERCEIAGGARIELNLPSGTAAFLPGEAGMVEVTGEIPSPPPSPTALPTGDTGRAARLREESVPGDATLARADTR